jgi:D-3-phosphoglycerate dehydrogenase / 2-oxoglutarate reductase
MTDRPQILVTAPLPAPSLEKLKAAFVVHHAVDKMESAKVIAQHGADIRAVLASGSRGFTAGEMDKLPALGLIAALGAGYDGIDVAAAKARDIAVTHAVGTNNNTVADQAMGLLISVVRALPRAERMLRAGQWEEFSESRPCVYGKKIGILGLGAIGAMIAKRAQGFDLEVRYHNRNKRSDVPYIYCASPVELARDSDFLVIACPGGVETRHLVNRKVLHALGPKGYVVNVARGSVIDTDSLIAALVCGEIAGAALDVIENEPEVPQALLDFPNVVMTPHFGGRSHEAQALGIVQAIDNLTAFFADKPLLTPV